MPITRHSRPARPLRPEAPQPGSAIVTIRKASASTNVHNRIPVNVLACTQVDLRIEMDANPAKGEQISVEMLLMDDSSVVATGVVHWTEMRGSLHEVGIFLTEALPASVVCTTEMNRRTTERYRCRIVGQLTSGSNRPECQAVIVNYCYEGLAVRSLNGGKVDDKFTFRWLAGDTSRTIEGRIMWQIEQEGGFLLGAELPPGAGYTIAGL